MDARCNIHAKKTGCGCLFSSVFSRIFFGLIFFLFSFVSFKSLEGRLSYLCKENGKRVFFFIHHPVFFIITLVFIIFPLNRQLKENGKTMPVFFNLSHHFLSLFISLPFLSMFFSLLTDMRKKTGGGCLFFLLRWPCFSSCLISPFFLGPFLRFLHLFAFSLR